MKLRALLVPALILLIFAVRVGAEDQLLLRQHWEPGKVYTFESKADMKVTAPGAPDGGHSVIVIQQVEVTVRREPDTERKLAEVNVSAFKAVADSAGVLTTYDSNDPTASDVVACEPSLLEMYGVLLGKSTVLVFDKDDQYVETIVGPEGKEGAEMLREEADFALPADRIAVGGTFATERRLDAQPLGSITTTMKGRLDGLVQHDGRRHARIVMDGTVKPSSPSEHDDFALKLLPGATVATETLFDLERRMVSVSITHNETDISVDGVKTSIKQVSVSTLQSIKDIKDAPKAKK